ncbi:MAG: hypothetical protein IKZ46_06330, partial [Victivallales bacterium]|nr:hypothetical protein [Victivallales bacterium]
CAVGVLAVGIYWCAIGVLAVGGVPSASSPSGFSGVPSASSPSEKTKSIIPILLYHINRLS